MAEYARVISAFPGVGKTHFSKNNKFKIIDSDSSKFSWIATETGRERNPDFPKNYIEHIKENLDKVDIILVSSHEEVRKALAENEIEYALLYPHEECKEEYLDRFIERSDTSEFIKMMDYKWEDFLESCKKDKHATHLVLQKGQYLSDLFLEEAPDPDRLLAYLKSEALKNGLEVFIFEKDELKQYYDLKDDSIGVAVVARNKENAIINLKNGTHSYILKN
jgi:hypothetical protein